MWLRDLEIEILCSQVPTYLVQRIAQAARDVRAAVAQRGALLVHDRTVHHGPGKRREPLEVCARTGRSRQHSTHREHRRAADRRAPTPCVLLLYIKVRMRHCGCCGVSRSSTRSENTSPGEYVAGGARESQRVAPVEHHPRFEARRLRSHSAVLSQH